MMHVASLWRSNIRAHLDLPYLYPGNGERKFPHGIAKPSCLCLILMPYFLAHLGGKLGTVTVSTNAIPDREQLWIFLLLTSAQQPPFFTHLVWVWTFFPCLRGSVFTSSNSLLHNHDVNQTRNGLQQESWMNEGLNKEASFKKLKICEGYSEISKQKTDLAIMSSAS